MAFPLRFASLSKLAVALAALAMGASACRDKKSPPPPRAPAVARAPRAPTVKVAPKGVLAKFERAAVASANPIASEEAAKILAEGGNAMDAAVACALVLGVVEPHSAGIGGGGFLLHFDARTGQVRALDYRERAPRRAHRDLYRRGGKLEPRRAVDGHLAVGVPGTVAGLHAAHAAHGRLPWKRLVEPAARIAELGYEVQPRVATILAARADILRRYPASAREFLPGGAPPKAGSRLRHPELAATLRAIASEGPAPFYTGPIAAKIADELARGGGLLDRADLAAYKPIWREPVRGKVRGVEVVSMPPPSSGGVHVLQMLNILAGDRLEVLGPVPRAHLVIEAMRRAFADRAELLGDPAFVKVPVAGLTSAAYAKALRTSIDPKRATPSSKVRAGKPAPYESRDTTHLSVVDADGNAVTLTQSINYGMGAGVVVPGTGILLNDTMDDFAIAPGKPNVYGLVGGEANAVAAGKTPLSSMTPTLVLRDGKVWFALGSPGGSTIITVVLNVLLNRVVRGLDLAASIGEARLHHQWLPDVVRVEMDRPGGAAIVEGLEALGHRIRPATALGNVNAVEIATDGSRLGVADPRQDGAVAGY